MSGSGKGVCAHAQPSTLRLTQRVIRKGSLAIGWSHSEASKMVSIFLYVFRESCKRVSIFDRETEAMSWRVGRAPTRPHVA